MATKKEDTARETAQEPVKVEGLEVSGGKVVAVPPQEEKTGPAEIEPEQAAKAPTGDEEVVANIGHVRIRTEAEKRVQGETDAKEDHWMRPAKEAHADAARLGIVATSGNEFAFADLKGIDPEGAGLMARVRLLFDWNDGQGVFHARGKELDLLRNEAAKLVEQGLAERVNPPEIDPIERAMTEAQIDVLTNK